MTLFSQMERDILQHRLAVPDAIAEVLIDSDIASDHNLIVGMAISLSERLNSIEDWYTLTSLEQEILINAVEGSTFVACLESDRHDGVSPQKLSSAMRINTNLARKLSTLSGRRVNPVNF